MKQFAVRSFHQTLLVTWDTVDEDFNFTSFMGLDHCEFNLGRQGKICSFCRLQRKYLTSFEMMLHRGLTVVGNSTG